MPLTKLVDGVTVEMTAEEEAEVQAEWSANADLEAQKLVDPTNYRLTLVQFHAVLEIQGLVGAVEAAIDAMTDAEQRALARSKMKHSTHFDRDDPLFEILAPAVGLTQDQIDALWMQAKDL